MRIFIGESLQSPEVLSCGYEVEFVAGTSVAERLTSGAAGRYPAIRRTARIDRR